MLNTRKHRLIIFIIVTVLATCCSADVNHCSKPESANEPECLDTANKYTVIRDDEKGWIACLVDSIYVYGENIVRKLVGVPPQMNESKKSKRPAKDDPYGFDGERVPTLDELKLHARKMATSFFKGMDNKVDDITMEKLFGVEILNKEDLEGIPEGGVVYEYPPLFRHMPKNVDDVTYVETEPGKRHKVIALSTNPPIFEVPDFISEEDCDHIVEMSEKKGLIESRVFTKKDEAENNQNTAVERRSSSTYLTPYGGDIESEFMETIYKRISKLLNIPVEVIRWSEPQAIGRYVPGGFYHAHLDSTDAENNLPCCFQTSCESKDGNKFSANRDCCRICRYATVLYYLSDVEEGGETAFPFADTTFREMLEIDDSHSWKNLTEYCHDSPVVVKPKKGKAVFWYNHTLDKNGYIASVDKRSYHGGCDVIKGTKWIATNWISTPKYNKRYLPSKFKKFYTDESD